MTVDEIKKIVEAIAAKSGDPEGAHVMEDALFEAVLEAIAGGLCDDPAACAKAAIKTVELKFPRWYA